MHVCKGGQISEVGAKFPRKFGPRGPYFLGNLARGGKFPVTPGKLIHGTKIVNRPLKYLRHASIEQ